MGLVNYFCKFCKENKNILDFWNNNKSCCKSCILKRKRDRYNNDQKFKIRTLKNNSKSRKKNNNYSEKRKVWDEKYSKQNFEKIKQTKRKWEKNNREKCRMKVRRRREREKQIKGYCTYDQWINRMKFYGNRCYYCKIETKLTMDHRIPISRGGYGWPSNLVPACLSCNSSKRDKTEKEFLEWKENGIYS
jgi:5-methylcytosine-specific restriction endonuclease McrA